MRAIKLLLQSAFDICTALVAITLIWKAYLLNDVRDSVAQDRMDMWIAVGVAYILFRLIFDRHGNNKNTTQ